MAPVPFRSDGPRSRGAVEAISLTLPLPPSTNHIYTRTRYGGMALTEEATRFRENVKTEVVRQLATIGRMPVSPETVYRVTLRAYFDQLENPGWFKALTRGPRKGERDAKSRYKALDIDNRIKFLQDCVIRSVGIPNDSQVFESRQIKLEDPDHPRAEVLIEVGSWSDYFPKGGRYGPQTAGR